MWSAGSEKLAQMEAVLARSDYPGGAAFWIALDEAPAAFGSMLAVRIFGEGWQSIGCEGAWHADSAGGPTPTPTPTPAPNPTPNPNPNPDSAGGAPSRGPNLTP